jgi:radical SAM superfamily enzyme YgiQ (UPF0313 family)
LVAFLIVGLPGETRETILSSAKFIQQVQRIKYLYYDNIGILMVYPGTEVCRLAKEAGMLNDDFWLTDKITPLYTVEHSEAELFEFKKLLLDHIALKRMKTVDGFKRQLVMLPFAAKFVANKKNKIARVMAIIKNTIGVGKK